MMFVASARSALASVGRTGRVSSVLRTAARAYSGRPEPCQVDNMTQIGARRVFTEEHDMFRESVRQFYQEEVVPCVDGLLWAVDGI